jgi:hypothetical protein
MTEQQEKEIEHHLSTFQDRHQDTIEMKREWAEYKTKAFWVLLGFVGSILSIGIWVGTMQTNIDSIITQTREDSARFVQIETRLNSLEVTNGEIRARLSSIDLALQEIKIAINKLY